MKQYCCIGLIYAQRHRDTLATLEEMRRLLIQASQALEHHQGPDAPR